MIITNLIPRTTTSLIWSQESLHKQSGNPGPHLQNSIQRTFCNKKRWIELLQHTIQQ
jgi:hypothetical protein